MKKEVLIYFFFIVGFLFMLNSQANITGAVVGIIASAGANSTAGFIFMLIGLVLLAFDVKNKKDEISDVIEKYEVGRLNAVETVHELNKIVQIKNVHYTANTRHSVSDGVNNYPIHLKNGKKAMELALTEYLMAIRNNPREIGRKIIELSEKASTKHYTKGFLKELKNFRESHKKELSELLKR